MKNCKKCKKIIDDAFLFCPWCGTPTSRRKTDDGIPEPAQLPSGSYRIQMTLQGRRRSITAPTKKECIAEARRLRAMPAPGDAESMTLGEIIRKYIDDRENILSPSTIRGYRYASAFLPELQAMPLCDITPAAYQAAVNRAASSYTPKTLRNYCGLIASATEKVCHHKLSCDLPRKRPVAHAFLEPEQIGPFMELFRGRRSETAVLLGLHSLRRSEILALLPGDYHDGTIHVHSAKVYDEHGHLVETGTTKTASSTRDVPVMIPRLLELLPSSLPVSLTDQQIYRDIRLACQELGIENIGIHGLRHSFASLAAHLQMPEKEAMRIGGWSSPQIMREIYTHVAEKDRINSENRMRDFFTNAHELHTEK